MGTKLVISLAAFAPGCKKGSGGGGGGWFVGTDGTMRQISDDGTLGQDYNLGATETLNAIACRAQGEAWVVGEHGTLLYTNDGGDSWSAEDLATQANLRTLATQDAGPVFLAGGGAFFTATPSSDGTAAWRSLGHGESFTSLAAAQKGTTVLALADDGRVFAYADGALSLRSTVAGAHAIAVSPDGLTALAAGDGLSISRDAGATWTQLVTNPGARFEDVRVENDGSGNAVGAAGLAAMIDAEGRVLHSKLGDADLHTMKVGGWASTARTGYAAGDGGETWLTTDGGWSWTAGPDVGGTVLGVDIIGAGHR
ncbi:MAG TPA: YCF48-related protein [Kofleriaceae bacterium]|jgi:photosystem II stability/assembly factor-like uncharacterized protein